MVYTKLGVQFWFNNLELHNLPVDSAVDEVEFAIRRLHYQQVNGG